MYEEGHSSGYIIEDGQLIPIDKPNLHSLNKYAYDVIQVAVKDHFAELDEDAEGDYELLKGNVLSIFEKNAMSKSKPGRTPISVTALDAQSIEKPGQKSLAQRNLTQLS